MIRATTAAAWNAATRTTNVGRWVTSRPTTTYCRSKLINNRGLSSSSSSSSSSTLSAKTPVLKTRKGPTRISSITNRRPKATLVGSSSSPSSSGTTHISINDRLADFFTKQRTIPIPRWITPKHQTISLSEVFGHSSFVLVAVSYAVDDFLELRILAVAGSSAMLIFNYFHPYGRVLWLPFKWNCLFIAINLYRIGKVYLNRYLAEHVSEEFINLRNHNFYHMDPVDFWRLVRCGEVHEYNKGDVVVSQGQNNRVVRLILSGEAQVFRDGKQTYFLEEANFVSEGGLHVGLYLPGPLQTCCSVVVSSPKLRVLEWDRVELVELMERYSGVRRALKAILSWDIIRKLKAARTLLASGHVGDPEAWAERRRKQTVNRYAAILQFVLHRPLLLEDVRPQLNKYRLIHDIDDKAHEEALRMVGWTPLEYERGHRQKDAEQSFLPDETDDTDAYADELRRDWRWYLNDIYLRVFG